MPTHIALLSGSFVVELPLEATLNATQTTAFEMATAAFIDGLKVPTGDLEETVVEVKSQNVEEITNGGRKERRRRKLMNFSDLDIAQHLVVKLAVTSQYTGTDVDFDFEALLNQEFHNENPDWLVHLAKEDALFDSIVPDELMPKDPEPDKGSAVLHEQNGGSGSGGVSGGGIAAAAILSVFAKAVGIAAAVYSVKYHKENVYGQELESASPRSSGISSKSSTGSRIAQENLQEYQRQYERSKKDDDAISWRADQSDATPLSPNSLELGKSVPMNQMLKKSPNEKTSMQSILRTSSGDNNSQGGRLDHIVASKGSNASNSSRAKDPPTAAGGKQNVRNMVSLFDNAVRITFTSCFLFVC